MKKIAVLGDPVLDQIYHTSDELVAGGKILGRYFGSVPGGTTANFACAAARFGLQPSMIGHIAANWEGDLHRDGLMAFGVAVEHLKDHDVERGTHTIIAIGPDGEKTLIYVPFPEVADAAVSTDTLQNFDMAYIMAADFERVMPAAEPSNVEICVDVDAAAGLSLEAFESVSSQANVLFVNDIGFQKLMGRAPDSASVQALLSTQLSCVCCTGGGGISFAAVRHSNGKIESVEMPARAAQVVDTTGAGDCFNAAFLTRRSEGVSLEDCMTFAMAAGALATEKIGAREAIPDRNSVLQRLTS